MYQQQLLLTSAVLFIYFAIKKNSLKSRSIVYMQKYKINKWDRKKDRDTYSVQTCG